MQVTLEVYQLRNLLADAAEMGATKALSQSGAIKPYLSKSEAYKIYGRRNIDRWIKEKLLKKITDGISTKVRLDRSQLEAVAKSSNRASWFSHNVKEE